MSYDCYAWLNHAYPFRPSVKTAADQTPKRSITTQPITVQPPPLPTKNGVLGVLRTSLLHREPLQSIRQAVEFQLHPTIKTMPNIAHFACTL
jgi:hypothetical protein